MKQYDYDNLSQDDIDELDKQREIDWYDLDYPEEEYPDYADFEDYSEVFIQPGDDFYDDFS